MPSTTYSPAAQGARADSVTLAGQQTPIDLRTRDATLEDHADATAGAL